MLLCALLLALTTVSDGFLYLMLQKRNDTPANMLPLFYVGTASFYMLFSLPVGLLADRWGRTRVLIAGFAVLPLIYLGLLAGPFFGVFDVALMLASTLHAIATGNLLPAGVETFCVDINQAVVTKLADRGSHQALGIVTDVGPFVRQLADHLVDGT